MLIVPTQNYMQNNYFVDAENLLMQRNLHMAVWPILHIKMASNDTLNSIVYNSCLKHDINVQLFHLNVANLLQFYAKLLMYLYYKLKTLIIKNWVSS